jgi:hypothetical protein
MKAIRNFAIIATMASFVVACGGKTEPAEGTPTDSTEAQMPAETAEPTAEEMEAKRVEDSTVAANEAKRVEDSTKAAQDKK